MKVVKRCYYYDTHCPMSSWVLWENANGTFEQILSCDAKDRPLIGECWLHRQETDEEYEWQE